MTPTVLPTPGWLARTAAAAGQEAMLSLLAAGLLIHADGGDPETFYTEIAAGGPLGAREILLGVFADNTETYPYLAETTGPLTDWMRDAPPVRLAGACRLAAVLADVDLIPTVEQAGGDLLGQVYDEMTAINRRLRAPMEIFTLEQCLLAACMQLPTLLAVRDRGGRFLDGACGSGVRVMGVALVTRAAGIETMEFAFNDPDPIHIALAAVNMALIRWTGPLTFTVGPGLASTAAGRLGFHVVGQDGVGVWQMPADWTLVDYELALRDAQVREAIADDVADWMCTEEFVRDNRLAGATMADLLAGAQSTAGDDVTIDDRAVDYGPTRVTRPRVKRKKRVRRRH